MKFGQKVTKIHIAVSTNREGNYPLYTSKNAQGASSLGRFLYFIHIILLFHPFSALSIAIRKVTEYQQLNYTFRFLTYLSDKGKTIFFEKSCPNYCRFKNNAYLCNRNRERYNR